MSLPIVYIAKSTLLSVGSARATTVVALTDGNPTEGPDMRGNFYDAVNAGPSWRAGKAGSFTSDNTSGGSIAANNRIGNKGCGAALPFSMLISLYAAK